MTTSKKELHYFPKWMAGREGYAERIRYVFQEFLRKRGLKATDQRRIMLDYMLNSNHHLSQKEIYESLRQRHSNIGKVTVFRMLKLLEDCDLVRKVEMPDGTAVYELSLERPHHDHLICLRCGAVQEVQWPQIEKAQNVTCRKYNFKPLWHRHETFGYCEVCAGTALTPGPKSNPDVEPPSSQ